MRKKFIAGNWKMNLTQAAAVELASGLKDKLSLSRTQAHIDVAVCPPFVYLATVAQVLKGSNIALGAQNAYYQPDGAYTGEISVEMLKNVGCRYVIIGHSERRHIIGENDELINHKIRAALAGGLEVIFCVGELLEQREKDQTEEVIENQLRRGLAHVYKSQMALVTIAYEPVWAIGTGKVASPQQAQQAHAFSREIITTIFDQNVAQAVRIQYGGSVIANNAADLLKQPDVDGALVGGASLQLNEFLGIIDYK